MSRGDHIRIGSFRTIRRKLDDALKDPTIYKNFRSYEIKTLDTLVASINSALGAISKKAGIAEEEMTKLLEARNKTVLALEREAGMER